MGIAGLCLAAAMPGPLLGANYSYLVITAATLVVGLLIAGLEARPDRQLSAALFVWAMLARLLAVTACYFLAAGEGGPFLGPDSAQYFAGSADLAARAFHLDTIPVVHFGTYDVAQYYLFASAIRFAGADLFGLQVLNCALSALAVPFVFGAVRVAVPPAALPVSAIAALGPTLIALCSVDLLKDPSVLCATVATVWAILRLTREQRYPLMLVYLATGLTGALYLHTARFYSFAYLEFAFIGAALFVRYIRGARVFARPAALVMSCVIFVAGEVIPARAHWPLSGVMVMVTVSYTLNTPSLMHYAAGFFDGVQFTEDSSGERRPPEARASGSSGERRPAEARASGSSGERRPTEARASGWDLRSILANLFRRYYGPFIWILPRQLSVRSLLTDGYLMYPGMLVWYALLPVIVAGTVIVGWGLIRRREESFGVVWLWLFAAVNFAQYSVMNLSYRQRDVMLPVLLVFAYLGLRWGMSCRHWQRWYLGYWVGLAMTAAAHLVARSVLGG